MALLTNLNSQIPRTFSKTVNKEAIQFSKKQVLLLHSSFLRSSHRRCSVKNVFLEIS